MELSSLGARASGKALSAGLAKRKKVHYCYCRACISLAACGPHNTTPPAARAFVQKSCPEECDSIKNGLTHLSVFLFAVNGVNLYISYDIFQNIRRIVNGVRSCRA
jgi:hypothetical protein